jgi:hypothetical protein
MKMQKMLEVCQILKYDAKKFMEDLSEISEIEEAVSN